MSMLLSRAVLTFFFIFSQRKQGKIFKSRTLYIIGTITKKSLSREVSHILSNKQFIKIVALNILEGKIRLEVGKNLVMMPN